VGSDAEKLRRVIHLAIFRDYDGQGRDRSAEDRRRHRQLVEESIKKNIGNIIAEESIIGQSKDKIIKVPIRGLKEYGFIYGENRPGVAPGTGSEKRGDRFAGSAEGPGTGDGAGSAEGDEYYELDISLEDLAQYLFEDLELPYMERKKFSWLESEKSSRILIIRRIICSYDKMYSNNLLAVEDLIMLELKNLYMTVNDENGPAKEIIRGINLLFEKGKVYAITGPNGGGKTSIAKLVMGIFSPSSGGIYLNGEDITQLSISERAHRGISYAFQQPPRFKGLTIEDLIKIARPGIDQLALRGTMRDVGLCPEDYLSRDVGPGLSGGEVKRVEIAQVLARGAEVTIFDEPEAGVDLWTIQKLIGILYSKFKDNPDALTIIITHNENILRICDEIIVIANGMVEARGSREEVWPLIKDDVECKMKEQCGELLTYEI
jgi:Fe-S cluster assembly ATP-binding protein